MDIYKELEKFLFSQTFEVINIQSGLTALPAFVTENGGEGEWAKAQFIKTWMQNYDNFELLEFSSEDARVSAGFRPNLIYFSRGNYSKRLWLFAHLDVVPPGDLSLWLSDPWKICVKNDLIFGRGVEDNQQAIVSMLLLIKGLASLKINPETGLGLVFMADEESGSCHGLQYILKQMPELFSSEDYYIVPDGGSSDGSIVEVAEKGQLWIKFVVTGKQCHASMPEMGINAFTASSQLVLELQKLNSYFNQINTLFSPPYSTFVPTRHDKNVEAVNILPGKETFYMDCRLLPEVPEQEVLKAIENIMMAIEKIYKVKVKYKVVQSQKATSVSLQTALLKLLREAVAKIYKVKLQEKGIGGATVAAFLREKNLPALVWSCLLNTCHQPNECSSITATIKDACVFAYILTHG